jgi:hypothetical protein
MKKIFLFVAMVFALSSAALAQKSNGDTVVGIFTAADNGQCLSSASCAWMTFPANGNGRNIIVYSSGTWVGTILVQIGSGGTWQTVSSNSSNFTSTNVSQTYTTDVRLLMIAYTSGTATVTISRQLVPNTTTIQFPGAPAGGCIENQQAVNASNGNFYTCSGGVWVAVSGGGSMVYPGAGVPQSTGSAWGTSITLGTGVATALAAAVSGTGDICLASGSACTGGGGNTTSTSLTTGYLPKASGANAIVNSAVDDGITAANTLTYTGTGGITSTNGPILSGGAPGLKMQCTTVASPTSGYVGFTPPSTCTNYGFYNLPALPASAGLFHVGAISSNISAVTVSPVVSADLNITGTTCTNQVITAISSAAAGTCANVTGSQMTANTVTATQLAAQYSKRSCEIVWGGSGTSFALTSGDDAIANYSCRNGLGVTETIASIYCTSDNGSNTTTINPTFGSAGTGTTILSGALTCGSSGADSSAGSISNSSYVAGAKINPVMGGTLTGTQIHVYVNFTY